MTVFSLSGKIQINGARKNVPRKIFSFRKEEVTDVW
jgi:hypothetical protein